MGYIEGLELLRTIQRAEEDIHKLKDEDFTISGNKQFSSMILSSANKLAGNIVATDNILGNPIIDGYTMGHYQSNVISPFCTFSASAINSKYENSQFVDGVTDYRVLLWKDVGVEVPGTGYLFYDIDVTNIFWSNMGLTPPQNFYYSTRVEGDRYLSIGKTTDPSTGRITSRAAICELYYNDVRIGVFNNLNIILWDTFLMLTPPYGTTRIHFGLPKNQIVYFPDASIPRIFKRRAKYPINAGEPIRVLNSSYTAYESRQIVADDFNKNRLA